MRDELDTGPMTLNSGKKRLDVSRSSSRLEEARRGSVPPSVRASRLADFAVPGHLTAEGAQRGSSKRPA